MPDLAAFIDGDGGENSSTWKYLAVLDRFESAMQERGFDVPNGLRAAVLYTAMARKVGARDALGTMLRSLKIPKAVYFSAIFMIDSVKRLAKEPSQGRRRFVGHRDFPDALDYNRIVARAEGQDEQVLDKWANLYNLQEGEET